LFLWNNIRWISMGFLLMFSSSFGQTFFIALSGSEIRQAYGLTSGEFGSLYTILTLASALILSQIGFVLDTYRLKIIILLSVIFLAAGAFLIGISPNILTLFSGLFLLRLFGQGMMLQCAFTALGRWFVRERGRAVSLSALGLNAGEAVLPISFVAMSVAFDWRIAWVAIAGLLLVVALPILLSLSQTEREPDHTEAIENTAKTKSWSRGEVLRDPYFFLLLLGVLPPAVISSSVFFHQSTMAEVRGWSENVFASSFTVYACVAVLTLLIAGPIVDRFSTLKVLPLHLLPLSAGCWLLWTVDQAWSMYAFMALYALTDAFSLTMFGSLWPDVYGTRHLGAVRGVLTAILAFATAIGPGVSGLLIDYGIELSTQVIFMGAYCVAVVPILLMVTQQIRSRLSLVAG